MEKQYYNLVSKAWVLTRLAEDFAIVLLSILGLFFGGLLSKLLFTLVFVIKLDTFYFSSVICEKIINEKQHDFETHYCKFLDTFSHLLCLFAIFSLILGE